MRVTAAGSRALRNAWIDSDRIHSVVQRTKSALRCGLANRAHERGSRTEGSPVLARGLVALPKGHGAPLNLKALLKVAVPVHALELERVRVSKAPPANRVGLADESGAGRQRDGDVRNELSRGRRLPRRWDTPQARHSRGGRSHGSGRGGAGGEVFASTVGSELALDPLRSLLLRLPCLFGNTCDAADKRANAVVRTRLPRPILEDRWSTHPNGASQAGRCAAFGVSPKPSFEQLETRCFRYEVHVSIIKTALGAAQLITKENLR